MRSPLLVSAAAAALTLALAGSASAAGYEPGQVLVEYEAGVAAPDRARVESETGTDDAGAAGEGLRTLAVEDGDSVRRTVRQLRHDPRVASATPNYVARVSAPFPNDPVFGRQWHLFDTWGANVPAAWDLARSQGGAGGRGTVVAVIDTGVAFRTRRGLRRAPDLRRFKRGYDFIGNDRFPHDLNGHGTHVAGTIGQSTGNGIGGSGVAYRTRIMPLRALDTFGEGNTVTIARAVRFATRRNVDVINLSIEFESSVRAAQVPLLSRALTRARRKGITIVAASGNSADDRRAEGLGPRVSYPARARGVIAVGGTTDSGCQAEYSNGGGSLDVVAPGGGADAPHQDNPSDRANCRPGRVGRDVLQQTFRCDPLTAGRRCFRRFGFTAGYYGTSMASGHVSGLAALLISSRRPGRNPSPREIERQIESRARDLGPPGFDIRYGHGLIDAGAALR